MMGEAAEWEIWRRHGVDISDDQYLSNPPKRKKMKHADRGHAQMGDGWQHKDDYPELTAFCAGAGRKRSLEDLAADGLWRSQGGGIMRISKMEQSHLQNSLQWAKRNNMPYRIAKALKLEIERRESAEAAPQETEGSKQMNTQEIITVMQLEAGATLVKVRYEGAGESATEYTYKSVLGIPLALNDLVLVEARGYTALARVTDPNVSPNNLNCRFDQLRHIMARIDLTNFENIQRRETEAANKLAMAEVSNRLAKYRDQLGDGALSKARLALGYPQPQGNSFSNLGGRFSSTRPSFEDADLVEVPGEPDPSYGTNAEAQ